ncbi:MAG: class I SAM-dependent methyltransferase [Legionellales bacterium]|nr:class I SAM-dependent methyltransferase [Legionellales bacterium]
MIKNNYYLNASIYAKHSLQDTAFLAFKYIPSLVYKYLRVENPVALDYGCGSGRSTRFIKDLDINVNGFDIDHNMLKHAKSFNDDITYQLIRSATIPTQDKYFDIAFSFLVLFELSNKNDILSILEEVYRVLKLGSVFIIVTGSEDIYSKEWVSLDASYPQNINLSSGDIAKIKLKDIGLELFDYYWTDMDYRDIFSKTHFTLEETLHPKGDKTDGFKWLDETMYSPYVIYVLKK